MADTGWKASCSQEFGFAVCAHVQVKLPWSVGLMAGQLARAVEADTGLVCGLPHVLQVCVSSALSR